MNGRSPSPRSSFKELYLSSTQAMIRKRRQDVEHPLSTDKQVNYESSYTQKTLPHPIMLKGHDSFREQIKRISEKFLIYVIELVMMSQKCFTNDHEEYRFLIHFLESDKEIRIII
ncbi:hypothetical protein TNCV_3150501 [Trichonephila clavipes]|nr:hypothetical protein TNCV_3150501 [Trichonephila clavipes]